MLENTTKTKLLAGETVLGCFIKHSEPAFAEFVAMAGTSWSSTPSTARFSPAMSRGCAGPPSSEKSRR